METAGMMEMEERQPLRRFDRALTVFSFALAAGVSIVFGVWALVAGDTALLVGAWPAYAVSVVSAVQLFTRLNPPLLFSLTFVFVVLSQVGRGNSVELVSPSVIALGAVGATLSLYVQRGIALFTAGYTAAMIVTVLWWYGPNRTGWIAAIAASTVFAFVVVGLDLLKRQMNLDAARYRRLFEKAPVAIWEEDFTEVKARLEELRALGIVDLGAYLEADPDEARRIAGLINVRKVNDAAASLMKASSKSELSGPLPQDAINERTTASMIHQLEAVWHGLDQTEIEVLDGADLEGGTIHLNLTWSVPRLDGALDYSRVLVAMTDITASKVAQQGLRESLRERDRLVATVSHELRTPLTTILGASEELQNRFDQFDRDATRELIDMVAGQSNELATIVDDLLTAAQASANQLALQLAPVNLVEETEAALRAMNYGDAMTVTCEDSAPKVLADPVRVRQIIRNLVVNARRYGGDEMRVVAGVDEQAAAYVEVRDTGEALGEVEREAIFERYYRTNQTPGVTKSVGLGLAVSRDLAKGMGGDLRYDHDGAEAVFSLRLPLLTDH